MKSSRTHHWWTSYMLITFITADWSRKKILCICSTNTPRCCQLPLTAASSWSKSHSSVFPGLHTSSSLIKLPIASSSVVSNLWLWWEWITPTRNTHTLVSFTLMSLGRWYPDLISDGYSWYKALPRLMGNEEGNGCSILTTRNKRQVWTMLCCFGG